MALRIGASEARGRVRTYKTLVNEIEHQAQKNFDDMDFENSNRRVDMEKYINAIKKDCADVIEKLDAISFED